MFAQVLIPPQRFHCTLAGVALAGLGEYGFGLFARPVLPQSMGSAILRAAPESAISQSRGCELAVNLLLDCC